MVGFLDVSFLSCCDVTFPEAQLPWPSPREPGWAHCTLNKNVLECICSQEMVDSFQFCNLSKGDEPKFDISLPLRNEMTAMRLALTVYKSLPSGVAGAGHLGQTLSAGIKVGRWSLQDPKSLQSWVSGLGVLWLLLGEAPSPSLWVCHVGVQQPKATEEGESESLALLLAQMSRALCSIQVEDC